LETAGDSWAVDLGRLLKNARYQKNFERLEYGKEQPPAYALLVRVSIELTARCKAFAAGITLGIANS
jgi:hypothetical protein